VINVYFASLPEHLDESKILLLEGSRLKEIEKIKNERVRREKYYVWRLFAYALKDSSGKELSSLFVEKNENGKWECADREVCFSLSHSRGALCVVVFDKSVGVDVEELRAPSSDILAFARKILNSRELSEFSLLEEEEQISFLISKWTQKEAVFKMLGGKTFSASDVATDSVFVKTENVILNETKFVVSVATEQEDSIFLKKVELI
jgi:4'-phosphopantetheinyl transferase